MPMLNKDPIEIAIKNKLQEKGFKDVLAIHKQLSVTHQQQFIQDLTKAFKKCIEKVPLTTDGQQKKGMALATSIANISRTKNANPGDEKQLAESHKTTQLISAIPKLVINLIKDSDLIATEKKDNIIKGFEQGLIKEKIITADPVVVTPKVASDFKIVIPAKPPSASNQNISSTAAILKAPSAEVQKDFSSQKNSSDIISLIEKSIIAGVAQYREDIRENPKLAGMGDMQLLSMNITLALAELKEKITFSSKSDLAEFESHIDNLIKTKFESISLIEPSLRHLKDDEIKALGELLQADFNNQKLGATPGTPIMVVEDQRTAPSPTPKLSS